MFEISIVHDLQDHQNWVMRQVRIGGRGGGRGGKGKRGGIVGGGGGGGGGCKKEKGGGGGGRSEEGEGARESCELWLLVNFFLAR